MARKAVLNRNDRRAQLIKRYAAERAKLRKILKDAAVPMAEKLKIQHQLQKLPRDSCRARYRNRCRITGRSRGVFRHFGISRSVLRKLAMNGEIPGVIKSSW